MRHRDVPKEEPKETHYFVSREDEILSAPYVSEHFALATGTTTKESYRFYDYFKCCPKWKRCYLVLTTGFLLRYTSENETQPKGCPIKLEGIFADRDDINPEILVITTFRKVYKFWMDSEQDVDFWLNHLVDAKLTRGKYTRGVLEMSKDEKYFESKASDLYNAITKAEYMIGNQGNLHPYM